ncbi:dnaJ homolog subfamily C member 15 isoform X2 [Sinocyclocheilus anshuiensis]|uniref:dnaJ homolog subfamily C member 15 isoform X2 n=1 Tax=Sinocyclocheilus anshuiensis TaxID=1608454 RepID=UPI0007BA4C45|nr:PREDICTED: dnaJ homolog subfamily C member 15 isoform X2 [Sinocyclocheilus anshuiensis]
MASSSRVVMEGDFMRNAEYTPKSTGQSETDIDKRLGGCLMAVGLGVAAAGFAGRYAFHLWRPLSQVITEAAKKLPSTKAMICGNEIWIFPCSFPHLEAHVCVRCWHVKPPAVGRWTDSSHLTGRCCSSRCASGF